jgi:lysophospholipase L1-like esterase
VGALLHLVDGWHAEAARTFAANFTTTLAQLRAISAANGVAVAGTYGKLAAQNLVGGTDCLHPNDSGHQIIADLFAAALAGASAQTA